MHKAKFVSRTGREITLSLVQSQDRLFVQRTNGVLADFADPLDDGNNLLAWVETEGDSDLRPRCNLKLKKLR